MKKIIYSLLFVFVTCFFFVCPVRAADELDDVRVYTQTLVDDAIVKIFNKDLTATERVVPFKKVVMDNFDFDYISKFVLGVYARGISEEKLSKFAEAFAELNVYSYIKKFELYTDSKIDVVDVKNGKKTGQFFVVSKVRTNDDGTKDYSVDWRVMRVGDTYKVIDVVVEGVSMALSYKNEYAPLLKTAADEGKDPVMYLTDKILEKVVALKLK